MSKQKYEELHKLKNGNYECKIKVRVIRFWRGVSSEGEEFKGFNVILLDNKNNTIHAFIPSLCAYEHERKLKLNNVCIITNFTVQAYKKTDKFRSLRNEKQLIFSKNTQIQDIEDAGSNIRLDWFDLYDHGDLKALSQQNIFLADVVGIVKDHLPLNTLKNRHGKMQSQARFTITDGSSNVKVTFWDKFGDYFEKAMVENIDKPIIIIIASCRVGLWNEQVNLSNVAATKFYLNYQHHSVLQLRTMLSVPAFKQQALATKLNRKAPVMTVQEILLLGKEYMDTEVITHVRIHHVEEDKNWYYKACTTCFNEAEKEEDIFTCIKCNRKVQYPDIKFKIWVVASDGVETVQMVLDDREVRNLIGKRATDVIDQDGKQDVLPREVKAIGEKDYTVKIDIREANVVNHMRVFWATNICKGLVVEEAENSQVKDSMQQSTTQLTTSTMHLDDMSDVNIISENSKSKGKEVQMA